MKKLYAGKYVSAAILTALVLTLIVVRPHLAHADSPRVIEITAKRFEFRP